MIKPYYSADGIQIFHGDCREVVHDLEAVDAVITSPPYLNQRDYEGKKTIWSHIPEALQNARLKIDGQMLINLGLAYKDGYVLEYWSELRAALEPDFKMAGWYVWDKGYGMPGEWSGRLAPAHEFIFHFWRAPRIVNKTKRCAYAGLEKTRTQRNKDGSYHAFSHSGPVQEFKVPDSVLRITPQRDGGSWNASHPAIFPVELPIELIAAFTQPRQIVMDPFAGSGTTLLAAKELNRRAIGIELEEKYCEIAAKRLAQQVLDFG